MVPDDLAGVVAILAWLSYVPAVKGAPPPRLGADGNRKKLLDPIDRKVRARPAPARPEIAHPERRGPGCGDASGTCRLRAASGTCRLRAARAACPPCDAPDACAPQVFDPRRGPSPQKIYDPRVLLTGAVDAIGKWRGGLFDRGSFRETLAGWGMTTVCGRARLGGIPIGVIVPEQRTTTLTHPADPADADSKEKEVSQAGMVWFPDSAYKTATAIRDFNLEGLPLLVIANWRGFSGGQRDMYESILKFGSMIVEGLVDYAQVTIPPAAPGRRVLCPRVL